MTHEVRHGDCRELMAEMDANSVDAVVTDPPYGLSFMGKGWDKGVPGVEFWAEALRVAKPGAHLLAFGGTRMVHRLAVAIEDAGWEIRDRVHWVYGSGFPKSHNVSKAIDKLDAASARRSRDLEFTKWMRSTGVTAKQINAATNSNMGSHYLTDKEQPAVPTIEMFERMAHLVPTPPARIVEMMEQRTVESENFKRREVVGRSDNQVGVGWVQSGDAGYKSSFNLTAPATPAARQWDGWGTALKPAVEPIILARKPFKGTVAANVQEWGTGAINVDGCRVGDDVRHNPSCMNIGGTAAAVLTQGRETQGRWPANLIHDGGDDATEGMGDASRYFYCPKASKKDRDEGLREWRGRTTDDGRAKSIENPYLRAETERKNHHPTVKPTELMAYLCRLITPPGGTILDPFNGSGSTGKAAVREGFNYIGCELDAEYVEIARARIAVGVPA